MQERSPGKDTTTGHWELAGLILSHPFPTFPHGFPTEFIRAFESAIGIGVLGNTAASGTEIIQRLGGEHIRTNRPIVYTSADSVFQIAAHEGIYPPEQLYEFCKTARGLLTDDWAVGRVIARPFMGTEGAFVRTQNRKDFSLAPFDETMLDILQSQNRLTVGIGKIGDIFAGQGIEQSIPASGNPACIQALIEQLSTQEGGLVFINLVDFDMHYGHRRDPAGFGQALVEFDRQLPQIISLLGEQDLLILTADHGCDPLHSGTDHTREHAPVLLYGKHRPGGRSLGIRKSFADVASTVLDHQGLPLMKTGQSML